MSQPKRYNIIWTVKAEDPEMGVWVEWEDYAALAADRDVHIKALRDEVDCVREENAALAAEKATDDAEYVQLKQDYLKLRIRNASLAAENERLRKASFVTAVSSEEYERLKTALKDIEKAWYDQRHGDVIRIVDEAFSWRDGK